MKLKKHKRGHTVISDMEIYILHLLLILFFIASNSGLALWQERGPRQIHEGKTWKSSQWFSPFTAMVEILKDQTQGHLFSEIMEWFCILSVWMKTGEKKVLVDLCGEKGRLWSLNGCLPTFMLQSPLQTYSTINCTVTI